jgi:uncharacterized protein (TIGR03435 family)
MLKTLLAERFQLTVHRDSKLVSGYTLVVSKDGLKMRADGTEGKSGWNGRRGSIAAERVTMAKLADSLGRILNSRVVDQTNLSGVFTFKLEFDPESVRLAPAPEGPAEAPIGPSLFTVLQRQLGLKLEARKEPIEVVVVDKAEKLAEN